MIMATNMKRSQYYLKLKHKLQWKYYTLLPHSLSKVFLSKALPFAEQLLLQRGTPQVLIVAKHFATGTAWSFDWTATAKSTKNRYKTSPLTQNKSQFRPAKNLQQIDTVAAQWLTAIVATDAATKFAQLQVAVGAIDVHAGHYVARFAFIVGFVGQQVCL